MTDIDIDQIITQVVQQEFDLVCDKALEIAKSVTPVDSSALQATARLEQVQTNNTKLERTIVWGDKDGVDYQSFITVKGSGRTIKNTYWLDAQTLIEQL